MGGEGDGGGLKGWINLKIQNKNCSIKFGKSLNPPPLQALAEFKTQNKKCSTKFGQGLNPPPLRALAEFKLLFFKDGFPYPGLYLRSLYLKSVSGNYIQFSYEHTQNLFQNGIL